MSSRFFDGRRFLRLHVVPALLPVVPRLTSLPLICRAPFAAPDEQGQLPLSGVNLPGGVQRIRTSEDVLEMRNLFKEGDLLTCEVQQVQKEGTLVLHTRSLRYGKLENGTLVTVPPSLVGRRKNHFVTLAGKATSRQV